jgi:hypothetical protein
MDTNHDAPQRRYYAMTRAHEFTKQTRKALRYATLFAAAFVVTALAAAWLMRPSMFALSLGMVMLAAMAAIFVFIALDFQRDEDEFRASAGLPPRHDRNAHDDSPPTFESASDHP